MATSPRLAARATATLGIAFAMTADLKFVTPTTFRFQVGNGILTFAYFIYYCNVYIKWPGKHFRSTPSQYLGCGSTSSAFVESTH